MTDREAYDRALENHKEAWQMALDLNQSSDVRREWEAKRDAASAEMLRLAYLLPGFSRLPPIFSEPDLPWRSYVC